MFLQVASAIPNKSQQYWASIAFHAIAIAVRFIMRISQNSSALCDVQRVIARANKIENYRRRESIRVTPVSVVRKW